MKFKLHFVSVPRSSFGRTPSFSLVIECDGEADAHLIGSRMSGEPSWSFSGAEKVED